MKHIAAFLFACLITLGVCAQEKTQFTPDHFRATFDKMMPMSFPTRILDSGYYLEVDGDNAYVHLPYMGEVHTSFGIGSGVQFDETVKNLKVTQNKKGTQTQVTFYLGEGAGKCAFELTVFKGDAVDLEIRPQNAQPCSYVGTLDAVSE